MRSQTHRIEPDQHFYRIRDVARLFGVSETQVRLWLAGGLLRRIAMPNMSRAVRIAKADVVAMAERLAGQQ